MIFSVTREIDPPAAKWAREIDPPAAKWAREKKYYNYCRFVMIFSVTREIDPPAAKWAREIDPPAAKWAEPRGRGKGRGTVLQYCSTVVLCTV